MTELPDSIVLLSFPHAEMREGHCHWTIPTGGNERTIVPLGDFPMQE